MESTRHRALIVEDDPAIRRLVEKLLARRDVDFVSAHNGREAIGHLRDHDFSVVVLDLMLPEINGFELIDYIKREEMRVPVAVVSAVSQHALRNLDLDVVKLVIPKPFDVDEFTNGVVALCSEGAA